MCQRTAETPRKTRGAWHICATQRGRGENSPRAQKSARETNGAGDAAGENSPLGAADGLRGERHHPKRPWRISARRRPERRGKPGGAGGFPPGAARRARGEPPDDRTGRWSKWTTRRPGRPGNPRGPWSIWTTRRGRRVDQQLDPRPRPPGGDRVAQADRGGVKGVGRPNATSSANSMSASWSGCGLRRAPTAARWEGPPALRICLARLFVDAVAFERPLLSRGAVCPRLGAPPRGLSGGRNRDLAEAR